MTHTTTLHNPQEAHQTLQRLWGWLKPRLLQGQRITLSVEEERRNLPQNALLHATLQDIASRREWAGGSGTFSPGSASVRQRGCAPVASRCWWCPPWTATALMWCLSAPAG